MALLLKHFSLSPEEILLNPEYLVLCSDEVLLGAEQVAGLVGSFPAQYTVQREWQAVVERIVQRAVVPPWMLVVVAVLLAQFGFGRRWTLTRHCEYVTDFGREIASPLMKPSLDGRALG